MQLRVLVHHGLAELTYGKRCHFKRVTLWQIWLARNSLVFHHKQSDPISIVDSALDMHCNYAKWNRSNLERGAISQNLQPKWRPPNPNSLKINIDGSHLLGTTEGAIAFVCRDSKGRLTEGLARLVRASSAFQAEILACLYALRHFVDRPHLKLILESDCS
ncbi:hypothetical protein BT93_A0944 [Corymbia citriodora subsp. variegata]|nr:hypothetical protein BT93_A0944 [Corymbia citriodora subsp. variegata]